MHHKLFPEFSIQYFGAYHISREVLTLEIMTILYFNSHF